VAGESTCCALHSAAIDGGIAACRTAANALLAAGASTALLNTTTDLWDLMNVVRGRKGLPNGGDSSDALPALLAARLDFEKQMALLNTMDLKRAAGALLQHYFVRDFMDVKNQEQLLSNDLPPRLEFVVYVRMNDEQTQRLRVLSQQQARGGVCDSAINRTIGMHAKADSGVRAAPAAAVVEDSDDPPSPVPSPPPSAPPSPKPKPPPSVVDQPLPLPGRSRRVTQAPSRFRKSASPPPRTPKPQPRSRSLAGQPAPPKTGPKTTKAAPKKAKPKPKAAKKTKTPGSDSHDDYIYI